MKLTEIPIIAGSWKTVYGYWLCKYIRWKYGKDTHIFLVRGKTGDVYLYFRFLYAYLQKNQIENYVLAGDAKGLQIIAKLYPYIGGRCICMSYRAGVSMQTVYCLFGPKKLNMTLSLMWDVELPYNRCAVRLTDPFNYIDSYYWFLFDLDRSHTEPVQAQFAPMNKKLESWLIKSGYKKGRTVILSPMAYCVRPLSPMFWRLLGKNLKSRGYTVFVMLDQQEENVFGFPKTFFPYEDSAAVLEYAGHFIGLRSGFCDIISQAECNKVILYPVKPKEFDGSVHRADLGYSSLKEMELCDDAAEITVPFARNIVSSEPETEDIPRRFEEDRALLERIMGRFPVLEKEKQK